MASDMTDQMRQPCCRCRLDATKECEPRGGVREITMVGSGGRRQGNGLSTEIPALASLRV